MPQVMPPEILNSRPLQRIAPSLGVDLDKWIALESKNMGRIIALPPLKADPFPLQPVFRRFVFPGERVKISRFATTKPGWDI